MSIHTLPRREEMMDAFLRRDPAYEGVFVTAVRTTGIFCRTACSARKPNPENVEFFGSCREALLAGYRPCKRCTPLRPVGETPVWLIPLLDGAPPSALGDAPVVLATRIPTPLGPMVAAATDRGLLLLEFADRRMLPTQLQRLQRALGCVFIPGDCPVFDLVRAQLDEYFAGGRRVFDVPLEIPGTDFQRRVWDALRTIPAGETRSYGDIARLIGRPTAVRAVARTNGDNRLAILVPCHRVVGADGSLTGYGGGLWRKQRLLDLERTGRS